MKITMKIFLKTFISGFLILTMLLVPIQWGLSFVSDFRLFGGTESLIDDMPHLVDQDSPFFESFKDSSRVNILMIGVNDSLSDTLMLGSYDLKTKHADIISIPRDTYYERDGANTAAEKKINAVYGDDKAVGTAMAVSDVLMGIPINYYLVVEYDTVKEVVDSMGGVPMNITFHMHYNDPYDDPPLKIDIQPGYQILDGDEAVKFLRFRKGSGGYAGYPEGDIGRVKAQQEFMKSAFRQALGFSLPKVVKTTLENVDSDIPLGMASKLAASTVGLSGEDLTTWMIPGKPETRNGASYWFTDEEGIETMLMQIYDPQPETEQEQ